MDKGSSLRIISWISRNLEGTTSPRMNGRALFGDFKNIWRYRVGKYRTVAEINDDKIIIYVLNIGHGNDIYK